MVQCMHTCVPVSMCVCVCVWCLRWNGFLPYMGRRDVFLELCDVVMCLLSQFSGRLLSGDVVGQGRWDMEEQ